MFDYSKELVRFYKAEVTIGKETRDELRAQKKRNEERLREGLERLKQPKPLRFQEQGGYAMKTVVQHPKNDYDIDDGVVFAVDELKTPQGNELSALDARKRVLEALDDGKKPAPELHTHCVRIPYADGHHVDVPIYRESKNWIGAVGWEIAGAEWRSSNPKGVTEWFEKEVDRKSPDTTNDRQMRRIVAYLKALGKKRDSWNVPTGFMLTKLVDECYASSDRDDIALVKTMRAILNRLKTNLVIRHPVVDEKLTNGDEDPRCVFFREKLEMLLGYLGVLDEADCTDVDAAAAWDSVFRTSFFSDKLAEAAKAFSVFSSGAAVSRVVRGGDDRYA